VVTKTKETLDTRLLFAIVARLIKISNKSEELMETFGTKYLKHDDVRHWTMKHLAGAIKSHLSYLKKQKEIDLEKVSRILPSSFLIFVFFSQLFGSKGTPLHHVHFRDLPQRRHAT
jgi:hypothetical protein